MDKQDDQISVKLSVMLHREGPVYYLYIINLSCLLTTENVKYIFWNKWLWFHNDDITSCKNIVPKHSFKSKYLTSSHSLQCSGEGEVKTNLRKHTAKLAEPEPPRTCIVSGARGFVTLRYVSCFTLIHFISEKIIGEDKAKKRKRVRQPH